ncbi:MAG: Rrf2 family transcriptional regulator [Gemmatimonadota bacterium]
MKISRFSDISLRALMYLGSDPDRTIPSAEMAEKLRVSKEHLVKGLQTLVGLGLVESSRGRGGGYALSGDGGEMRLGALVRETEPTLAMAECFEADSTCPLTGNCRLAGVLAEAQRDFFAALDRYTLDDLLRSDRQTLVQIREAP